MPSSASPWPGWESEGKSFAKVCPFILFFGGGHFLAYSLLLTPSLAKHLQLGWVLHEPRSSFVWFLAFFLLLAESTSQKMLIFKSLKVILTLACTVSVLLGHHTSWHVN